MGFCAVALDHHDIFDVMDHHIARDLVHGLAQARGDVILAHDLAHFGLLSKPFKQVVGLNDAGQAAVGLDDGDHACLFG